MSVQERIEEKLRASLSPVHLQVINESHMHSVPPGSESHFKLVVVAEAFEGQDRVRRQQAIHRILGDELKRDVHALTMQTLTAARVAGEWWCRTGIARLPRRQQGRCLRPASRSAEEEHGP